MRAKTAVVLGAQWGDEGKGKIVDVLSERFAVVARYAGGHNAGHTVIIHGKKFILQLVPCGVLRPDCLAVIGNGVVLDPMAFLKEVEKLDGLGVNTRGQLFVSNRAQVILPYHRMRELAAENAPGRPKIGTTSRGIGPAYEDKMHRSGLRVVDLLNPALLRTHINNACYEKNTIAQALFGTEPLDPKAIYEEYARAAEQIAPFLTATAVLLNECAEIPICPHYRINGKLTDTIPADMRGFESIQPVYTTLKGWNASTEGITEFDKLRKLAQDSLHFRGRKP